LQNKNSRGGLNHTIKALKRYLLIRQKMCLPKAFKRRNCEKGNKSWVVLKRRMSSRLESERNLLYKKGHTARGGKELSHASPLHRIGFGVLIHHLKRLGGGFWGWVGKGLQDLSRGKGVTRLSSEGGPEIYGSHGRGVSEGLTGPFNLQKKGSL